MDKKLDNDLKNRIKEVFEDFEEASSAADEGWLQLRKKFPEEQQSRRAFAWIWWGAAAAVLLLFLGIGLWVFNNDDTSQQLSYKALKHNKQQLAESSNHQDTVQKTSPAVLKGLPATTGGKAGMIKTINSPNDGRFVAASHAVSNSQHGTTLRGNVLQPIQQGKNGVPAIGPVSVLKDTTSKNNYIAKIYGDSAQTIMRDRKISPLMAIAKTDTNISKPFQQSHKPPVKSIESMFAEDKKLKIAGNTGQTKTDDKRVHFGVYAATYFNYAKGSDNEFNAGAGFSSDIRISKNLKLVTGMSIAQNKLNYSNGQSDVAVEAAALPTKIIAASSGAKYNTNGFTSAGIAADPSLKSYNADLVGLDIPLNLKYEFNPQKSDTYISMGLSSGTFINESYTSQYNYSSFFNSSTQQTQGETVSKSFDSFYFAKTLNVAFGIGYPLGRNHLVIEPFLKYPLEGLGAQQIKFGAGGLNLKFNFQTSKK